MPRSRKHNSKKVKKNKTIKIVGGANLSNPNIGFVMVDHIDPMSNLRIDLTDLTPFYKHFELLQEPSLFNEKFQEKIDKAYQNLGKQVSRMMGEASEESPDTPQITTNNDEDVSVLNIDFFGNSSNAPVKTSNQTIQYEIINRDKQTIEFLMIVQKFKLLQYFCANSVNPKNNDAKTILKNVKQVVTNKNGENNYEKTIKDKTDNAFNSNQELIKFLNGTFEAIVVELKPETVTKEVINPFSLSWNSYEVGVLKKYQTQSNTIYGILAKILYNDIELQIHSEFITSPEPTQIENISIDASNAVKSFLNQNASNPAERKICMLKFNGKEDAKKTIESLLNSRSQ
jgi:hypothetical protein